MGILRQIGQLFWKNLLLRKREPYILLLELVWPVFIFVIVAVIRTAVPPSDKPTCSYAPHAMPSAGLVPFLQSSICNIDNKCEAKDSIDERLSKANKLSKLVSDVEPFIKQESTLKALSSIETAKDLANALVDPANNISTSSFLGNDTLKLRSFFKDPGKVKQILVDGLSVMSSDVADSFLDSTVNVLELLSSLTTGYIDFRGIVCDPTKLKSYMFFPKSTNVSVVSKELCDIPDSAIPGITELVQQQIDIASILRVAKSFTTLTNDYVLNDAIDDIATMIDLLSGTSSLGGLFGADIEGIKAMLNNIPMYLNTLNTLNKVDTKSFDDVLNWVDPLVTRYTDDKAAWNETKALFSYLKDMTDAVGSGTTANWTALLKSTSSLLSIVGTNMSFLESLKEIPITDITNMTMELIQGDMSSLERLSSLSSMEMLQNMLNQIFGVPTTQMMLGLADTFADMAMLAMQYVQDTLTSMETMMKSDSAVLNAMNKLVNYGPNVTMEVLVRLLHVENIMTLYNNTNSYVTVCHGAIAKVKDIDPTTRSTLEGALCIETVTTAVNQMVATIGTQDSQKKMESYLTQMDKILSSTTVPTDMKLSDVYLKVMNVTIIFQSMINSSWFGNVASATGIDTHASEWTKIAIAVSNMMNTQVSLPVVIVTFGPVLEETVMWKSIQPMLVSASLYMDSMVKQVEQLQSPTSSMVKMNEMLKSVTQYSPELVQGVFNMMKDGQMMKDAFSSKDLDDFCQQKFLLNMSVPSYVPMYEINGIVCDTDWDKMITEMTSVYDMSGAFEMAMKAMTANYTESSPFDWAGMMKNMNMMMTLYNDPESMTTDNPIVTLLSMNMSLLDETMKVVMYNVQQMTVQNVTEMTTSTMSLMKQLDNSLSNDTTWRTIKVYLDVWNSYVLLANKQMENSQFDLLGFDSLLSMSSTLADFVTTSAGAVPGLLDALKNTTIDSSQFFKVLLNGDWTKICQGKSIMALLSSSEDLLQFEKQLCKLNWTKIAMELGEGQDPLIQNYMKKVTNLAMMDFNNVPNIDLDWDIVISNTQKMFDLLMKVDMTKMMEAFSWDSLLTRFDLHKSNTSWSNFVKVFTMAKDLDVENLIQILDGLNSVGSVLLESNSNNTLSSMEASILQSQLYQQLQIYNFLVKQLQYFNDTKHVDLRRYFKSEEMNKLFSVVSMSPEISTVALLTMIETLQKPTKVNQLMTSWEKMCSDLSTFKSIISIPANVTVDPADLQTKICGVNINYTKLFEELMAGVDGLQELVQAMTQINGTATPKEIWKTYETFNQLLTDLIKHPPNLTISNDNSWLSEAEYVRAWEDFVSRISEGIKPENYMNTLTSLSQQLTAATLQNLAAIPEVNTILQQLSVYMKVVMARLNQSSSVTDIRTMFDGYPEMEKVLDLMEDLPQLYQVWVFNSIYSSNKISNLLANTQSWDQFCGMTDILSDLPGSNFSVSGFHTALCKLNLTSLLEESTRYNAVPEIEQLFSNTTTTTTMNTTELVEQFNAFSKFLMSYIEKTSTSDMGKFTLPTFLDMQRWTDAINQLNLIIGDPTRLAQLATSLPGALQSTNNATGLEDMLQFLIDSDATFRQLVQTTRAIYHVVEYFLDKMTNKTTISIDDIFGNATETMILWDLFVQPGVLETLLNSVNSPKMSALFTNDNITSVILTLCYTGNFSEYFIVPSHASIDVSKLKTDFCAIDLMKVISELMEESEILSSIITESFSNSTSASDLMSIIMGVEKLTTPLTSLLTNPPSLDLPVNWMNASYWLNMLAQYTESRQDQRNVVKELMTFMTSVQPLLTDESFRSIGHIMDTYLKLLIDNLQSMNSTTLSLDNLFRSVPSLSTIYTTLQINDSALIELLQSPIKNPEEFVKLMSMSDPYKYFCEDEKYWHVIFVVSADTPDKICSGNMTDILEKLMTELKVADYLSAVQNASALPDWKNIIMNSMKLSEVLTGLMTSDSVKFDASKTLRALSQYNSTDYLWNFLSYFQSLNTLSNDTSTSILNELLSSFKTTQMGMHLTNVILDKLLQPGSKLDFGAFLKNGSSVSALLNSLGISGESVNQLFSGFLKPGKVSEFISVLGDSSALESFLCDANQWNEMFQLSINVTDIVGSLCRTNTSNVLMMLMEQFHLDDVIHIITNQNSTFDIKTMVAEVEKLTANVLKLFNITMVDLSGIDLSGISQLNVTALESAIMKETEKLEGLYPDMYAKLLENILMSSVNTSDPITSASATVLAAANLWLSIFNKQIKDMNYQPMNVSMLLHGSNVGKAIDMVLQNPEWMEELIHAQIDAEKLSLYLMSNFTAICSDKFWADVVTNGNLTAVHKVWQTVCALNETTITQEAMSGFVNNYLFQQQLAVLMEELNKGVINMSTLYPNIMEFSNILSTMMQKTDFAKVFNVTSLVNVLERLRNSLMKNLDRQIPQWSSMLTSLLPQDDTLVKSVQTFNLIMQEINNRLTVLQGTSGTSMLIQNSTELISILNSIFRKTQNETVISNEINVSKLSEVIGSTDLFTSLCKSKKLGDYITPDGVLSQLAKDLGSVMCIYPEALQQVLMDQSKSELLQKQIEMIWNSTTPGAADWNGLQQSVTNFTTLLTALFERPPLVDNGVTDMLDWSLVLRSLEGMFTSPQMMFALTKSFSSMLNGVAVDPAVYPYYLSWQEVYKQLHQVINSLEGSSANSQGAIQSLWNSMSSLNSHLDLIKQNATYSDLVADLGTDPMVQAGVCYLANIEAAGSTLPLKVREALCGQDPKIWNQRLVDAGFPEYYGYFLLTNMKADSSSTKSMAELLNRFMTQIQNLTETLSKMSSTDLSKLQKVLIGDWMNPTISPEFYQSFNWLNLNDNSTKTWLLGMLNFVTEINAYVERQYSVLKGMGSDVPFTILLPNNTGIAELLVTALGSQTAAVTMAFYLAPDKFMEIAFSNSWQEKICNDTTTFAETFRIPLNSGVNITALQHDLCADLSRQDSAIRDILNRLNMKDVFKAFDDWMAGKTSSMETSNTTKVYKAIQKKIEEFVTMVTKIENTTLTQDGLDAWLNPIWNAMGKLNKPQDSIGETCDAAFFYIENTAMYRDEIRPILVGVYQNMEGTINQMKLQTAVEEILCAEAKNSSDFLQNLFSSHITRMLQKILNPNMNVSGDFQCSDMVKLSNHLSGMLNESMLSAAGGMAQCGDNIQKNIMMVLADTSASFQLMQELLKMMSDPGIKTLLNLDPEVIPLLEMIMDSYNKQQAVSIKVQDLITSPGDFNTKIQQAVKLAPEIINTFLQSTVNADAKLLSNISSVDLKNLLCNSTALGEALTLPSFGNLSTSDLTNALCFNSTDVVFDIIRSVLNLELLESLGKVDTTDLTWWAVTLSHLGDVLGHLNTLSSLPDLDFNNLQADLLIYMQKFLFDNGPEVIAKSLNLLIEDFARLDPKVMTSTIVKDIQTVTLGLTSLKVIRNFIPPNVLIRDVLSDRAGFVNYLTHQLNMSTEVANALISSTIQYATLLKYEEKDMQGLICNATRLKTLLEFPPESNMTAEHVVSSLCSLSEEKAINLTQSLLRELDIGDMVKMYVSSGLDNFFKSLNRSQEDVRSAVTSLTSAQDEFQQTLDAFQKSTEELDLNIFLEPEYLTGDQSKQTFGDLLCGYDISKVENSDGGKDLTGASSQLKGFTEMLKRQEQELAEMPASCKNVYDLVKEMGNGPVLWEYLKPLLWGKLLYTPDTIASRLIAEKVYNSSFQALADVQRITSTWAKGTKNLMDLIKDENMKSKLESVLGNEVMSSMMTTLFGVSASDFLDGFYSLDSVNTSQIDAMTLIAQTMDEYLSCVVTSKDRFVGVGTEQQLEIRAGELNKKKQFFAGLVFNNLGGSSGTRKKRATTASMPKHVSYTIRMDIDNVAYTRVIKEQYWQPKPEDSFISELRYFRGFIQLQDLLDRSIISLQTGTEPINPVYMQQFPSTCYRKDMYLFTLSTFLLPILMTVAWLVSVAIATRNLLKDREKGQEEILKIMGMSSAINWWVWFICTMIVMSIVAALCILTLRLGDMYTFSNIGILFLYFLTFCFSSIMMCYMVSAFFTQTTLALLTVVIVYLMSYLPYILLVSLNAEMVYWEKTLACLSSTTAFGFAALHLARYETLMEGIQWSNIANSPIPGDETSFSWTCIMMLIDGAIYLVIGWYVRNVKPGKYGVAQPWYFFVSPYYWGRSSNSGSSADKYRKDTEGLNEQMDKKMVAGVSINNLTKKFGSTKAVDNINAEFYEHQVTILLGHNGAAKTTTLNMITGVLQPSSGSVKIHGKSPSRAKHIGICPQHNALFDYMTVEEHMKFYGTVKSNMSKLELEDNTFQLLKEVGLLHVHDTKVSQLSGGMQKRLGVALAFVGGSEVVILDEPSSGVDPSARRAMWNLIMKRKTNCTILLSTHFLDEADMIGDRIAIMHNGRIMCSGSPHYLKAYLGSGYHLKIAKGESCDQMSVMGLITSLLPKADLVEDIGAEMTVSLSATLANVENLQKCLYELDHKGNELGIASYGLYDTTLEEVFLKVCDVCEKGQQLTDQVMHDLRKQTKIKSLKNTDPNQHDHEGDSREVPYADPRKRVSTISQSFQQIGALLVKRFHHYRRDWRMLIGLVILPLIFVAAGLGFYTLKPTVSAPKILLTPALYGPDAYVFSQDNAKSPMSMKMKYQLYANPGPGTSCMAGMDLSNPFTCVAAETTFHTPSSPTGTPKCSCVDSKYTCNDAAKNQKAPWITTNTTDRLFDLEGHDITDYLLMTRSEFIEKRYGGWSFDTQDSTFRSTVWFNNKGHHALPSFYNTLSNTMLRSSVLSEPQKYGISVYSHPLMLTNGQLDEDSLLQKAADFGIGAIFLIAFTFIPAGLAVYAVNEYVNKEKQLQFLSGVGPFMYWTTSLLWDMFVYCIMLGLSVAVMAAFRGDVYWDRDNLIASVALIILYGWATLPQMYMTVKCFKDSTTSYMVMFCLNVFTGILSMTVVFALQFFSNAESIKDAYLVMRHVFKIFPPYNLVNGFVELITNHLMADVLSRFGDDPYIWPFKFDVIGWHLVAMGIAGFVFFTITLVLECSCSCSSGWRRPEEELDGLDEAVINEKKRVMSGYASDDLLVVKNLTKEFKRGRREFYAVDHISVGVPRGECFGLLGENGAGKTTSFKMLTGDLIPTAGGALIKGERVTQGNLNIGQEVGYCPQEDALDGRLTGREMLHCYAKLRGLPAKSRNYVVDTLIKQFGMKEADKIVHTYSGGMKRKLSVAMAMLGEPPVVLLDEPTTGMDPNTRRHVWNLILAAIKNQQSVVLSSHSMEECDALCTRATIMVNGEFRCLGSPQQLKHHYGNGYIVTIYLSGLSTGKVRVRDSFINMFHGARTQDAIVSFEDHQGVIQIEVPKGKTSVADIFGHLERVKHEFDIIHYSVSQTTLDNVFLYLTKDQNDGIASSEVYDSSSEGSHLADTWGEGSSDAFSNPAYSYTNTGFTPDKDSLQARYMGDWELSTKM